MAVVPEAWTRMMGRLPEAALLREAIRSRNATQIARDTAVKEYTPLVDGIIDDLLRLKADGDLGRVTLILSKKERS
jgi:hypothetical protein